MIALAILGYLIFLLTGEHGFFKGKSMIYTYMDESMSVKFTLTAQSSGGTTTTLYNATLARLDLSSATVTRETGDLSGDSCTNFTADAGTFSSPDASVSGAHCYRYSFTIKDNAGNTSTAVTSTAKVDTDNPSVTLTDPGTPLAGVVSLAASASDSSTAIQQVVFERAPAGGSTWTTIGTDTSAPYAASWNTGGVADGLYDVRAVSTDTVGHTASNLVAGRRVDNTSPGIRPQQLHGLLRQCVLAEICCNVGQRCHGQDPVEVARYEREVLAGELVQQP